jgi:SSS family solute:Na+ symporter
MSEFLILLLFYAIAGSAIAFYARKYGVSEHADYFIAGRSIGGVISALTYAATTYSAFMMVGLVGLAYASGVGAAGFELLYLVGTLFLLSYYSPKIWRLSKEHNVVSPAELLSVKYGRVTAVLASTISLIALIPYTSSQVIGVSLLLEKSGAMQYEAAIAVTAILIAFWALIGGLRGVAWTDALQGLIMLTAAVIVVIWVYFWGFGAGLEFTSQVSSLGELLYVPNKIWTPLRFAALSVPWFFFALTNPQVLQRLFIPKDPGAIRRMVILFGTFGLIYTILVTFLGLELRVLTELERFPSISYRDDVTPTLLTIMPSWLSLLVAFSIIAAAITTANSIILSLSSMVSRDIVRERGLRVGQVAVIVLTILVALFAMSRPGYIVELSVLSSTILLSQLPLILGLFHGRGGKLTGAATLIAGFTTSVTLSALKLSPAGIPASIWTFIIVFAVFFAVSQMER